MSKKQKIVSSKIQNIEYQKANLNFLSSILVAIFSMVAGFLVVKVTLTFYGEPTNGIIRFISQIFIYVLALINSISSILSIQLIKLYKQKK